MKNLIQLKNPNCSRTLRSKWFVDWIGAAAALGNPSNNRGIYFFSQINIKLINLLTKTTDDDHHKFNKFSQITMKSIYLKNDIKTNIMEHICFWLQN